MFTKNNMRLAYSAAGSFENNRPINSSNDSFKFQAANSGSDEFNEFNSFDSSSKKQPAQQQRQPRKAPAQNRKKPGIDPRMIIAIVAVVAVVFIAVIIAAVAFSDGNSIKYDDNAYIVYTDAENNYFIALNGEVIDASFESEIFLTEAKDRSFAYVEEKCEDGWNIYFLNGKEMESVTPYPVDEILDFSEYEPGVVYKDDGCVYLYTEKKLEQFITDNDGAANFMISGDGTCVAYNEKDAANSNKLILNLFTTGKSSVQIANLCEPAAISYDGSYVYCYGYTASNQKKLHVIDVDDNNKMTPISDAAFDRITAMNAKGDEIIYSTITEAASFSHIYSVKKNESFTIAKGYFEYVAVDPDIACPSTFKDSYLQNASALEQGSTYYVNRKYAPSKIAEYIGEFSNDGKYFYFLTSEKTLYEIDLKNNNTSTRILPKVEDFELTQKGNLYILDEKFTLKYRNCSDKTNEPVAQDVAEISMYDHSNTLYFVKNDSVAVYSTKEASTPETVEFDGAAITGIPLFKYNNNAKTYAFLYDADIGWKIFYTRNGKSFKHIATAEDIDNGSYTDVAE